MTEGNITISFDLLAIGFFFMQNLYTKINSLQLLRFMLNYTLQKIS